MEYLHLSSSSIGKHLRFCLHLLDNSENDCFDVTARTIIRRNNVIHAIIPKKGFRCTFSFFRIVNSDRLTAICLYKLHTWNVGQTVTNVNHVSERYSPLIFRRVLIELVCTLAVDG